MEVYTQLILANHQIDYRKITLCSEELKCFFSKYTEADAQS